MAKSVWWFKKVFQKTNFKHRQGSGYTSKESLSDADITKLIFDLERKYNWIGKCISEIDVTNIGETYSLKPLFNNSVLIQKNHELSPTAERKSVDVQIAEAKAKAEKYNAERQKENSKNRIKDDMSL